MIRVNSPGLTSGPNEWLVYPLSENLSQYVSGILKTGFSSREVRGAPDNHESWITDKSLVRSVNPGTWMTAYELYIGAKADLAEASRYYLDENRGHEGLPTAEARIAFESALSRLLADGGSTPQPGLTYDGGIETQWLVNGQLVSLVANADGSVELYALDADGRVILTAESGVSAQLTSAYSVARELLESMGRYVVARVPVAD